MTLSDLCKGAIPTEIFDSWTRNGITTALPVQQAAVDGGLFLGVPLLVIAPTSSGKTFLGEMLAVAHAARGSRAIYIVPYKAIAEERYAEFAIRYSNDPSLGFQCIVSDHERRENDSDLLTGKYDIAILTYEKLSAMLVANQSILNTCGCVIIDEIQLVGDESRGPGLELLLTKLRRLNTTCQVLGLSAVLGDLDGFENWLGCQVIRETSRPVELRVGVVGPGGRFDYREANSGITGSEAAFNDLGALTASFVAAGEQTLIFANSVKRTFDIAQELAAKLGLPAATSALKSLNDEADTDTREKLLKTLCNGVSFHNAECELPERLIVEAAFRSGELKVLVSTTTLAMGVNLPVDNVILADNQKWSVVEGSLTRIRWSASEVKNMLGRAGRYGKSNSFGRGVLIASTGAEVLQYRSAYLDTAIGKLKSALQGKKIDERVLTVIASGYATSASEVQSFLFDTFAGGSWRAGNVQIAALIDKGIKECESLELIEQDANGSIKVTALGCVCAGNHLALASFGILKSYVLELVSFDVLDASFAAASVGEVKDSIQRIKWNDRDRDSKVRAILNAQHNENQLAGMIQRAFRQLIEQSSMKFAQELTIASVCRVILETNQPVRMICREFNISGSNLREMCEKVAWMVDTMAAISDVLRPQFQLQLKELAACLKRRVPFSCRYLSELPSYIGRDERIRLVEKGIDRTEVFLEIPPSEFAGLMSPTKAARCLEELESQRHRTYSFWRRDHIRRLDRLGYATPLIAGLYDDTGLALERTIELLFNTGFAKCVAQRITKQGSGEPDLLLVFDSGKRIAIQITAKESNSKFVDSKKAGDVISQSARYTPDGFICIGRPDFETLAREHAGYLGVSHNYKQLPVYVLAELFVQTREAKVSAVEAEQFFLLERGYITVDKVRSGITFDSTKC